MNNYRHAHLVDELYYEQRSLRGLNTGEISIGTVVSYTIIALVVVHQLLSTLGLPLPSVIDIVWLIIASIIPTRAITAMDKLGRRLLGYAGPGSGRLGSNQSSGGEDISRIVARGNRTIKGAAVDVGKNLGTRLGFKAQKAGVPPGLGNWDNSCYQNSILQALASMPSLIRHTTAIANAIEFSEDELTSYALSDLLNQLNDPDNQGSVLWTPGILKSMSSWQQQDAQEYFSKMMDNIEKEAKAAWYGKRTRAGLEQATNKPDMREKEGCVHEATRSNKSSTSDNDSHKPFGRMGQLPVEILDIIRNPMEGLMAQRVGCLRCGYSDGLSMIPFNCLTLTLGRNWVSDIGDCLDGYTEVERIEGVSCPKCTLIRMRINLENLLQKPPTPEPSSGSEGGFDDASTKSKGVVLSEKLREMYLNRLGAINSALEDDDYSDETLKKKCNISQKAYLTTTKTRQAVVARQPQCLVIHINRSIFNEATGTQRKNYADLKFNNILDLDSWSLAATPTTGESSFESWEMLPSISMIGKSRMGQHKGSSKFQYRLCAAVTHFGRHEDGHYICYRRLTPPSASSAKIALAHQWWRISDDNVYEATERDVMGQGGAFMLFYERESVSGSESSETKDSVDLSVELVSPKTPATDGEWQTDTASEATTTEEETSTGPTTPLSPGIPAAA